MSNKSCSIDNHNHTCANCHSNCHYSNNKAACPDMFHFLIKLFIHNNLQSSDAFTWNESRAKFQIQLCDRAALWRLRHK